MGVAGLVVGVENGAGVGFVVGIGGSGDGSWDGSNEGVVTTLGEGVGEGTITGAAEGFVDGDTPGEDGVLVGEEDGEGEGNGLVGTEEGSNDGMLLGDGVGLKSQTSIRHSSTKIASSLAVKSIDMGGGSPGLDEHLLNAFGPMTLAQFEVMLLYPGTRQDSGDPLAAAGSPKTVGSESKRLSSMHVKVDRCCTLSIVNIFMNSVGIG
jgi:hypothetical protein